MAYQFGTVEAVVAASEDQTAVGVLDEIRTLRTDTPEKWEQFDSDLIEKAWQGQVKDEQLRLMVVKDVSLALRRSILEPDQVLLIVGEGIQGSGCFTMNPGNLRWRRSQWLDLFKWKVGIHRDSYPVRKDAAQQIAHDYFEHRLLDGKHPWGE